MASLLTVRRVVTTLLLLLGLATLVTGMLLYLAPRGPAELAGLDKETWKLIHTYFGFAAAGVACVHVSLNWQALRKYLGL